MTSTLRAQLEDALGAGVTIQRELGGGGMSRVFLAEEVALRRRIVIKVLPQELLADLSVARFQREIALAARLQHPHIVPLIATGNADGLPYFTMPFVDGESLRDRLARGGELPVAEATRLLREIASALAYAHEQGVVHRDIKPENILLTGGIALVTDFGVAKALIDATTVGDRPMTAAGVAVGTPAYMSPEQVSADPAIDHRADLYALGVVAYEMLAGRAPFVGRTTQALLAAHIIETPDDVSVRRPAVPPALAALIMRCLEKRPADRPQSAADIVRALDVLATPSATTVTHGAPGAVVTGSAHGHLTPEGSNRRNSLRWVAVAVALLVVVAAGAWYVQQKSQDAMSAVSSRIVIAPFENLTGDARFDYIGKVTADRLAFTIAQVGTTDVVPSNTVIMALRDTSAGLAGQLQRLARATHAGMLVTGSVIMRGDSLVLQGQVSEVPSGRVVQVLAPASGVAKDPVSAVDALGDHLLGALGRRELRALATGFRAPTYAAYQEFAAGFERFAVRGDNLGSRPYFERAIALDSNYVQAYQLLIRQYLNFGEFDRADSLLRRVERLPGTLTATERAMQDYARAELEGNTTNLLRAARQVVGRDSAGVPVFLVGEAAMFLMQPQLAIQALQASESTYVLFGGRALQGHIWVLAKAFHQAGMYERERQLWRTRGSAFPDLVDVRGYELRAYAGLHQGDIALALADSMLRDNVDPGGAAARAVFVGAQELRAHGDSATGALLASKVSDWYRRSPARDATPARLRDEGLLMLDRGAADSAVARFTSLARDTNDLSAAGFLGLAHVARGDRDRARAIADSLGALHRPWLFGTHTYWRAVITAALGDREHAVQLLKQSASEGVHMATWHYTFELAPLRGYAPFETMIRPLK